MLLQTHATSHVRCSLQQILETDVGTEKVKRFASSLFFLSPLSSRFTVI